MPPTPLACARYARIISSPMPIHTFHLDLTTSKLVATALQIELSKIGYYLKWIENYLTNSPQVVADNGFTFTSLEVIIRAPPRISTLEHASAVTSIIWSPPYCSHLAQLANI